eukprot:gene22433-28558_t
MIGLEILSPQSTSTDHVSWIRSPHKQHRMIGLSKRNPYLKKNGPDNTSSTSSSLQQQQQREKERIPSPEDLRKPTSLQHSQSSSYLDPTICDKRPPLHRQHTTGHMDTCSLHRGGSRSRRQIYRGGAATAERRAHSSIAFNQYKHTGAFEQPPRHPPPRKAMHNSLASFRRIVGSADFFHETYRQQQQSETLHNTSASSSFYFDANSSSSSSSSSSEGDSSQQQMPMDEDEDEERGGEGGDWSCDGEEDGEVEELPPLLIETLLSAPQLRVNNPAHTERLREKMAVETLMLEWGWAREVAQAVYVRQGQLQEMRNRGVSLAEYAELAQRRLSGHKHGMSSRSFPSGNHQRAAKKRSTSSQHSDNVEGVGATGQSKPHPCALQMPPPSIHFVF